MPESRRGEPAVRWAVASLPRHGKQDVHQNREMPSRGRATAASDIPSYNTTPLGRFSEMIMEPQRHRVHRERQNRKARCNPTDSNWVVHSVQKSASVFSVPLWFNCGFKVHCSLTESC